MPPWHIKAVYSCTMKETWINSLRASNVGSVNYFKVTSSHWSTSAVALGHVGLEMHYMYVYLTTVKCKLNTISSFPWYFTDAMNSFCCNPDDWCKHTKYTDVYSRYMRQTWGKSPFLGRLRGKSTSGNPEYMSMCTSGVVVVVLLFKWYCLDGR